MKQVGTAHLMYIDDYNGALVPVGIGIELPGGRILDTPGATYWPDLLSKYTKKSKGIQKCASAKSFGIGMNHPQLGRWKTDVWGVPICKYNSVANPGKTVCFADTGLIVNFQEKDPDKWYEDPKAENVIVFRTPDNGGYYDVAGSCTRIVNRHVGLANCTFLDGHAVGMKVSKVGFQYPLGDPKALWDIY
jgi:prepilin-type processing-associated H-X9-DG protein